MALNNSRTKMMHWRRARVADCLRGGWTQREMASFLQCSVGTINNDIRVITEHWRRAANIDTALLLGQQLADVRAIKARLWRAGGASGSKEYARVLLQCIKLEAALTGTLKPAPFVMVNNNVTVMNLLTKAIEESGMSESEAVEAFGELLAVAAERKKVEAA